MYNREKLAGGPAGFGATLASRRGRYLFERVAQTRAGGDGALADDRAGRVGQGQLPQADSAFHPGSSLGEQR